jgi:hypothetical protein
VFTKDRPAQLKLFLTSRDKFFHNNDHSITNILLKTTDYKYTHGYDKIKYNWNDTTVKVEFNFQQDVLKFVDPKDKFTVFFTDDDIFCNEFSMDNENFKEFARRDDVVCHSLRLNKNISYNYPSGNDMTRFPEFTPFNVFRWIGEQGYYGYPMSVNGHIFKTADIYPLLEKLEYDSPTWLEYQLSINPINKPFMNCNDKSIIVNNPCNVVQSVCKNRNEGLDNEKINELFLSGKRLSLDMVKDIEVKSCHQPIELIWE